MRLIALFFAILAAVPQALRWMAFGLGRMNKCTLPTKDCEIAGNDQSHILNMLWGPTLWTTTGLWIGLVGLGVTLAAMKIMAMIEESKSRSNLNRADKRSGVGHGSRGQGSMPRDGRDSEGRMPRPPAFDRHGRPRD